MENLIFFLAASLVLYKSSKKLRRLPIADTRTSVLFFPSPVSFNFSETEDGDKLYFFEQVEKSVTYGILCAQLKTQLTLHEAREIMTGYMTRLHKPFHALYSTGILPCKSLHQKDTCLKVVDYWQDEKGVDWKINSYTNGNIIAVLYVKNINEASVDKQDLFLDSFRFL